MLIKKISGIIDDAPVECPICQRRIIYRLLNADMDKNCEDPPAPPEHNNKTAATSWQKLMSGGGETHSKNGVGKHKGKHKYVTRALVI